MYDLPIPDAFPGRARTAVPPPPTSSFRLCNSAPLNPLLSHLSQTPPANSFPCTSFRKTGEGWPLCSRRRSTHISSLAHTQNAAKPIFSCDYSQNSAHPRGMGGTSKPSNAPFAPFCHAAPPTTPFASCACAQFPPPKGRGALGLFSAPPRCPFLPPRAFDCQLVSKAAYRRFCRGERW
jgi:hypothetical protein